MTIAVCLLSSALGLAQEAKSEPAAKKEALPKGTAAASADAKPSAKPPGEKSAGAAPADAKAEPKDDEAESAKTKDGGSAAESKKTAEKSEKPAGELIDPVGQVLAKKQKDEAERRAKAKKKVPRQELIDKPGAPRQTIPAFLIGQQMEFDDIVGQQRAEYNRMRLGQVAVDPDLVDKVIKSKVFRMSLRAEAHRLGVLRDEIVKDIASARDAKGNATQPFIEAVKTSVIKYAGQMLTTRFSIVVRVNVLLLLGQMHDERFDVEGAALPVVRVLRDPRQDESVLYMALKTLSMLKAKPGMLKVENERAAVEAIHRMLARGNLQDILLEQVDNTLGVLGRPYIGDIPDKAQIAVHLAKVCLDRGLPLRRRKEAAVALGRMDVKNMFEWRSLPATFAVGLVALDLCRGFQNEKLKESVFHGKKEVFEKWMIDLRQGWKTAAAAAWNNQGDMHRDDAVELMNILNNLAVGGGPINTAELEQLLNKHLPAPRDKKFTFQTEDLKFPEKLNGKAKVAKGGDNHP